MVSPTSHPPLFRASLPSSRLCTNTHLASKPITPSSHAWRGTNAVHASIPPSQQSFIHNHPCIPSPHILTFGVGKTRSRLHSTTLPSFHKPVSYLAIPSHHA
ncbi:hypothetical protein PIB30_074229 [Stylosanthes scabra]|uniref:Uncharacterized protein n=1 Tax=Stylosanthes scabra TaxID=79078 RepID=A0ABU6SPT5_9FABA|nr:hypothetical protein [Stylosanthes scabra]